MSHLPSPDLYQQVTDRIVTALEQGTAPWVCPWQRSEIDPAPANAVSGRAYRGINVLLLNLQAFASGFEVNRWLTYRQAQAAGGQVRRGEAGTTVVFFKLHELPDPSADQPGRVVPLLRSFTVFNVAQIDGLPATPSVATPQPWDPIGEAEGVLRCSGASIRHGGSRAYYMPAQDCIQLPARAAFAGAADYYGVALHELTHWTGHSSRCDRPLQGRKALDAYAFEELIAEMGAAFLCAHCRLPGQLQHASYIASWLKALRDDKRLIFTAASQAQRAADFVLDLAGKRPNAGAMASPEAEPLAA